MALLSSTTLFNFTDSIDFLLNNLKEGIYCNNNFEKLPLRNNGYRTPMACFCDIPLSLIKEHFDWYGRYGLGIKRTYARKLGVKPVWYITSESHLVKSLVTNKELNEYERKHLLPYLKQFMGNQEYKDNTLKRKKFYDEREWRYIPDNSLVEPLFGISRKSVSPASKKIFRMELDLNTVEYIIIENEKDFERMLEELKIISEKGKIRYETLVSKIMTSKQIERDF